MTFLAALRHDRVEAPWLSHEPTSGEGFRLYIGRVLVPPLHPGDIGKEHKRNKRNKRNK